MRVHAENTFRNNESMSPVVLNVHVAMNMYAILQFQKRWFTLENDRLSYYENVLVRMKELLIT